MSIPRNYRIVISFMLFVPFFISCNPNRVFEESRVIPEGIWNRKDHVKFEVPISDTNARYDFYFTVRNSTDYPYSNLYFFIHSVIPGNIRTVDTVECELADYTGKWKGTGMGGVKYNRFLFQEHVHFRKAGTYFFELEQAMRVTELAGIRDIGLRIEKNSKWPDQKETK